MSDAMGRGGCVHALVVLAAPTGPLLTQLAPSSLQFISLEYLQSSAQCKCQVVTALFCVCIVTSNTLDQRLNPLLERVDCIFCLLDTHSLLFIA